MGSNNSMFLYPTYWRAWLLVRNMRMKLLVYVKRIVGYNVKIRVNVAINKDEEAPIFQVPITAWPEATSL